MQKLAEICIRRPVFAAMLVLALVVVGAVAYRHWASTAFPAVDIPQVRVRAILPGAAAEETETEIAQRLEEAVNTVEGLDELRSHLRPGRRHHRGHVPALARRRRRGAGRPRPRVRALRDLPPEMEPPVVAKFDNESTPVLTVAVSADRSLRRAHRSG
jgi:HAE1 family hydrophobic/amphiphilic exporter-1